MKYLKRADGQLRAPCYGHGNLAQLKFGYKKKEGIVSINKGEQLIIEIIMNFRDEGLTLRQVSQMLTDLQIPSKNGKNKWHPTMVKRIIDNFQK